MVMQQFMSKPKYGDADSKRTTEAGQAAGPPPPDGREDDEPRTNLDSGYAWVILLVMFLLQSSIGGSARVYGLVYAKEVQLEYYDREQASWPIATASAVENLAGILSPALVQWLSWRNIELISTFLFVLANVIAYLSDSLALDIIALGLIQGLALSTCSVLSLIINNDYFERYRTTAYGVSMCGSTFGLLYLGPLVTWLLESYDDFRLVYLALAGMFCLNALLVLVIRPRAEAPKFNGRARGGGEQSLGKGANSPQTNGDAPGQQSPMRSRKRSRLETCVAARRESVASISHMARSRRTSVLSRAALQPADLTRSQSHQQHHHQQHPFNQHHNLVSHPKLAKSRSGIDLEGWLPMAQKLSDEALTKKISLCSMQAPAIWPLGSSPIVPANSLAQSSEASRAFPSRQSSVICMLAKNSEAALEPGAKLGEFELDVASLNRRLALECDLEGRDVAGADRGDKLQQAQEQAQHMDGFSFSGLLAFMRLPYLHCAWIMLALYYLIARIFVIILVDFAHDHGLDTIESMSLLNYWSLGELLGRLLLGSLIDLRLLSCRSCIAITCAALAILMACMVFAEGYLVYASCTTLVAALISLEYMLINVMLVEYVGKQMVTNCYSLAACISSLVLFGRPSMIGFFRDHLGSYDGLLMTLAAMAGSFAVLISIVEPLIVRRWPKTGASGCEPSAK